MFRFLPAVIALVFLAACGVPPTGVSPGVSPKGEPTGGEYARAQPPTAADLLPGRPSDAVAHAFARAYLDSIQAQSIADRVEYCGYFFLTPAGDIAATFPRMGSFAACDMPSPRPGQRIFASYHTHGAFGAAYDNEVPSVTDLLSDFDFAIDGYVSTPGGRIWHVDYGTRSTRQVCGLRCVYVDPGFRPVGEASIRSSYTLLQLGQRANGS